MRREPFGTGIGLLLTGWLPAIWLFVHSHSDCYYRKQCEIGEDNNWIRKLKRKYYDDK